MINLWIGWPGTGKTTSMIDFIGEHARAGHRFFVPDRAREFAATLEDGTPNPRWRGKPPPLIDVPYELSQQEDAHEWFDDQPEGGVFLFTYPWEGLQVAQLVKDVGNATYADDELDLVGTRGKWETNPLRDIVHRGRHLANARGEMCEAHICGAARRPQSLHTDLSAIAEQALIFRVQGKLTLDRLRHDSWIEDDEWDVIRNQPNLHCKHWPSGNYLQIRNPFGKVKKEENQQSK